LEIPFESKEIFLYARVGEPEITAGIEIWWYGPGEGSGDNIPEVLINEIFHRPASGLCKSFMVEGWIPLGGGLNDAAGLNISEEFYAGNVGCPCKSCFYKQGFGFVALYLGVEPGVYQDLPGKAWWYVEFVGFGSDPGGFGG
jgi:hypothetical protein